MVTEVPSSNDNSSDGENEETAEDKVDGALMAEAYEEENQSVHFHGSSSLTNPTPSTVSTTRIARTAAAARPSTSTPTNSAPSADIVTLPKGVTAQTYNSFLNLPLDDRECTRVDVGYRKNNWAVPRHLRARRSRQVNFYKYRHRFHRDSKTSVCLMPVLRPMSSVIEQTTVKFWPSTLTAVLCLQLMK